MTFVAKPGITSLETARSASAKLVHVSHAEPTSVSGFSRHGFGLNALAEDATEGSEGADRRFFGRSTPCFGFALPEAEMSLWNPPRLEVDLGAAAAADSFVFLFSSP